MSPGIPAAPAHLGDGLVYLNIAVADQPPPHEWQGQFNKDKITTLLAFLKAGGFFTSWDPGAINPSGTSFRMGANLKLTQVRYEGGNLDPPLYHALVYEHILPDLTLLSESGKPDARIAAILKENADCYQQVSGTPIP
jgi:hypothetical protein